MEQETSRLVFLTDPLSPLALVVGTGLVLLLVLHANSAIRAAGWRRGVVLVVLRGVVLACLGLVLLQPSLLEHESFEAALPAGFVHKEVDVLPADLRRTMLPPVGVLPGLQSVATGDVEIREVLVPPVAFYKSECQVRAVLVNSGPVTEGELVLSRLGQGGAAEVQRRPVQLEPGKQEVVFPLIPDSMGPSAWTLGLAGFQGNSKAENDLSPFALTVVRESVRVLHIAGHPSWDVRFLRQFLASTPGVELVSFYLLVEAEDFAPHSREELALIPFPTDELFLREIGNFDLIVAQNFPLGTYFLLKEAHLERLAQYVEEGGGLLMVGGDKAFSLGRVEKTPVAAVLPADLALGEGTAPYLEGPLGVRLAPEGLSHPVTTAGLGEEREPFRLSELPPLAGMNPLGAVGDWGSVLAVAGSDGLPLLVAGNRGKGRVLLVATDSLWKWAFPSQLHHESAAVYRGLLLNALAWLTSDPRYEELFIQSLLDRPSEGDEVGVRVCVRGAADRGTTAAVLAEWLDAGGRLPSLKVELTEPLSDSRCAEISLPPARIGAWTVRATVETDAREYSGSSIVVVERKRESYVQTLARRVAGLLEVRLFPLLLDRTMALDLDPASMTLRKPRVTPLWGSPFLFVPLVLLLLTEWLLRRRWGYL
ncbi:MAG: hypothetical protein FJ109_06495 [Deltaproteobacteria bacterium]|nr:hypothetical protein [Deltaproteobacteria bacterium]